MGTFLMFKGKHGELTCKPPVPIDTTGKVAALVYCSVSQSKMIVTANFVEPTILNDGSRRVLGVSDMQHPIYVPMKPNVETFEIDVVTFSDKPINPKYTVVAIVHIMDSQ